MHDLIREMDETINSEKSPTQPGRLEDPEAVTIVLTNEYPRENFEILDLSECRRSKNLSILSKLLTSASLFTPIGQLKKISLLRSLTNLNLSSCCFLGELQDFSCFPNLQELKLPGCWSLSNVRIGQLKRLHLVEFDDCRPLKYDCEQLRYLPGENVNVDAISSVNMANPAEWIFLVSSLCLEILSAACDQVSSPSRPRYSLFGMLFAIAALLTCIWELIYKGRKKNVGLRKRGCYMLFGSAIESYSLVGGIAQCVCSIIQYVYYIRRADTPIKLSLLPAIFLICLITARLSRKQMLATDQTHEHIA